MKKKEFRKVMVECMNAITKQVTKCNAVFMAAREKTPGMTTAGPGSAINLQDVAAQLNKFLTDTDDGLFPDLFPNNAWLEDETMEVYVRRTKRSLPVASVNTAVDTLDIASVEVREGLRGQGRWRGFVAAAAVQARAHGVSMVHVENVLVPQFADWFRKNAWIETKHTLEGTPSFYYVVLQPKQPKNPERQF